MRAFIERALIKAGYEVISFANGKEAHECLKEEPFTLLLTDIVMPQMDGIELARRASEIDPDLKIMFITGFAAVTLNTDSKAVKDARVLSKPFHLKDLVREIDRLLGCVKRNAIPRSLVTRQDCRYRHTIPTRAEPQRRARSSAVEHYLDMVGVTGSIPVAPTIF